MSEKVIGLLKDMISLLEKQLSAQENQLLGANSQIVQSEELSTRLLGQRSAQAAKENIDQLLGAISAYKVCVEIQTKESAENAEAIQSEAKDSSSSASE